MNYTDLTDAEINRRVAEVEGWVATIGHPNGSEGTFVQKLGGLIWVEIDYCNSWSDMGPIIEREKISLLPLMLGENREEWEAAFRGGILPVLHKNPLRATAICYLMMKESERCG